MIHPKVYIIILNWNGKKDTIECLGSIQQLKYPNLAVVVVDNGSTDGSVKAIHQQFPEISIIETGKNLGYAGGNNTGLRYALKNDADHILLLNNDTIVDQELINELLLASDRFQHNGIFGAKIYYYKEPNKIWYSGAKRIKQTANFMHIGQGIIDNGKDYNSLEETDYACGCAFFVHVGVLNKIGLFDEKFFLTYEEADLCYRAKRAGIKSYVVPDAIVWHKISISFGGEESAVFRYFITRNKLLWAEKNLPFFKRLWVYKNAFHEFLALIYPPSQLYQFSNPLKKAKILALRDYLLRRFGNCSESIRSIS